MRSKIVEATNREMNWGKFMLLSLTDEELDHPSAVDAQCKLFEAMPPGRAGRWRKMDVFVIDLQTGEGARFRPRPHQDARADLSSHRIWVCPLFEPFLVWLYQQPDPFAIPALVELPDAEFHLGGYRRQGNAR